MAMPSSTRCGSPSSTARFMNAPGSPSSALQITYFGLTGALRHQLPFHAGRETRAAAPAQAAGFDFGDDLFGLHRGEHLAQRGITVAGDVFLDVFRVNQAAIFEDDLLLFGEESEIALGGDDIGGDVVLAAAASCRGGP